MIVIVIIIITTINIILMIMLMIIVIVIIILRKQEIAKRKQVFEQKKANIRCAIKIKTNNDQTFFPWPSPLSSNRFGSTKLLRPRISAGITFPFPSKVVVFAQRHSPVSSSRFASWPLPLAACWCFRPRLHH